MDDLLRDAGIGPGMRVLDLGCGAGEVTRRVAALVGGAGEAVGLDASHAAVAAAEARRREDGTGHARFVVGDAADPPLTAGAFDAVVGRRVLMYVPAIGRALRAAWDTLRPGGVLALQEQERGPVDDAADAAWPLHTRIHAWVWDAVEAEGADTRLGDTLAAAVVRAGFTVERLDASAVHPGEGGHPSTAFLARVLADRICSAGVATRAQLDLPTLDARLAGERERNGHPHRSDTALTLLARKPA